MESGKNPTTKIPNYRVFTRRHITESVAHRIRLHTKILCETSHQHRSHFLLTASTLHTRLVAVLIPNAHKHTRVNNLGIIFVHHYQIIAAYRFVQCKCTSIYSEVAYTLTWRDNLRGLDEDFLRILYSSIHTNSPTAM